MVSEYSKKGLPKAKEDSEATIQQPTREKPGTTIPKSDPLDKRPKAKFDALEILILQRNPKKRRRLQFSILTLLILMLLVHISLAIFMWLRPDHAISAKIENTQSYEWLVLATYAGLLLLSAVIMVLVKQQKPDTAFMIFSGLLLFALILTPVAYLKNKEHTRLQEANHQKLLVNHTWITREVFITSAPGVWLLVLGGGVGFGISILEHPDL